MIKKVFDSKLRVFSFIFIFSRKKERIIIDEIGAITTDDLQGKTKAKEFMFRKNCIKLNKIGKKPKILKKNKNFRLFLIKYNENK